MLKHNLLGLFYFIIYYKGIKPRVGKLVITLCNRIKLLLDARRLYRQQ